MVADVLISNIGSVYFRYSRFDTTRSKILFVTFSGNVTNPTDAGYDKSRPGFGEPALLKLGCDVLACGSVEGNRYQDVELNEIASFINKYSKDYESVVAYGYSSGGFIALALSDLVFFNVVLLLSPNNPFDQVMLEAGWPHAGSRSEVKFRHTIRAGARLLSGKYIVVYDPLDIWDSKYVAAALRADPVVFAVELRHFGHLTLGLLIEGGEIGGLIRIAMDAVSDVDLKARIEKFRRRAQIGARESGSEQYLINFCRYLMSRGRFQWVSSLLSRLNTDAVSFSADVNIFLADYYLNKVDLANAERCARNALDLREGDPFAIAKLGAILADRGDYHEALRLTVDLISREPGVAEWRQRYSALLEKMGQINEAESEARFAVQMAPHHVWYSVHLARVLELQGKYEEAHALLVDAVGREPGVAEWRQRYSALLEKMGQINEAESEARFAVQMAPHHVWYSVHLARVLELQGKYEEAHALLVDAVGREPGVAEWRQRYSALLEKMGQINEAESEARFAVQMAPHHVWYSVHLARVLELQGKYEEAHALLVDAVGREPGVAEWRQRYSALLNSSGGLHDRAPDQ